MGPSNAQQARYQLYVQMKANLHEMEIEMLKESKMREVIINDEIVSIGTDESRETGRTHINPHQTEEESPRILSSSHGSSPHKVVTVSNNQIPPNQSDLQNINNEDLESQKDLPVTAL